MNQVITGLPDIIFEEGHVCPNNMSCGRNARFVALVYFVNITNLKQIEGHTLIEASLQNACPQCALFAADFINVGRREIWDEIPSYFGFPGWDDLKEKLAKAK